MTELSAEADRLVAIAARHGAGVPRYTSYPTAPHFTPDAGEKLLPAMLDGLTPDRPVSVYVHIPFCDRLCWFCGCHTKQTKRYQPVAAYVQSLVEEIALLSVRVGFRPLLAALHLGGGSPSLLSKTDFERLRAALGDAFRFEPDAEVSIEIDPSDVTADTLEGLKALGTTRVSVGVQDFDPVVQEAINRPQSFEQTRDVIAAVRGAGIAGVNIDCLYGLPHQTRERLGRTIDQVLDLSPERVALFGYAHVPWVKTHQRMIDTAALPDPAERFVQAQLAGRRLVGGGYQAIGIDHFALPADGLAAAARNGTLHRNFQGYTTDACDTMIGLGASSIGRFPGGYVQNVVPTGVYRDTVAAGRLPAMRGRALSRDDSIRGHIIERLMCDFRLDLDGFLEAFGEEARPYIREAGELARRDTDALVRLDRHGFEMRPEARPLARIVASWFDAYRDVGAARYSQAV